MRLEADARNNPILQAQLFVFLTFSSYESDLIDLILCERIFVFILCDPRSQLNIYFSDISLLSAVEESTTF